MPSYNVSIHTDANSSLQKLPKEARERLTDTVIEVSKNRKPTSHPNCELLDCGELMKVRVGEYRAILRFEKPNIDVVLVGPRSNVYQRIDTARARAEG